MPQTPTTEADPLAERRERLEEIREERARLIEREDELSDEIAEAVAEGASANGKREERRRVRGEIEDLGAAASHLEERLEDEAYTVLRDRAVARLQSIRRKVGGIAGQVPRRIEEARGLQERLVRVLQWLWSAADRRRLLEIEARLLADAFGCEMPELQEIEGGLGRVARDLRNEVQSEVTAPRRSGAMSDRERVANLPRKYGDEVEAPKLLAELEALRAEDEEGEA